MSQPNVFEISAAIARDSKLAEIARLLCVPVMLLRYAVVAVSVNNSCMAETPREASKNESARATVLLAASVSEKDRIDACRVIAADLIDTKQLLLLMYLAADKSMGVRREAIWAFGTHASRVPSDLARQMAHICESELKSVRALKVGPASPELVVGATCLWTLHELYCYSAIVSPYEFTRFEADEYSSAMRELGLVPNASEELQAVFLRMVLSMTSVSGVNGLLPLATEILQRGDMKLSGAVLLIFKDHPILTASEFGRSAYHEWARLNLRAFEELAQKYSELKNQSDSVAAAAQYLQEEILPIGRAAKKGAKQD